MKHPLTSKERRGLVAVAAAALLCIAAGPLLRACSIGNSGEKNTLQHQGMSDKSDKSDKSEKSEKSEKSDKSKKSIKQKKSDKSKTKKVIPVRSPLDQPCD